MKAIPAHPDDNKSDNVTFNVTDNSDNSDNTEGTEQLE